MVHRVKAEDVHSNLHRNQFNHLSILYGWCIAVMAEAVYCVNVIKKREEPLFSMLDAPASPRMGPYFKFGREQPIQSFVNPVRMVHRVKAEAVCSLIF